MTVSTVSWQTLPRCDGAIRGPPSRRPSDDATFCDASFDFTITEPTTDVYEIRFPSGATLYLGPEAHAQYTSVAQSCPDPGAFRPSGCAGHRSPDTRRRGQRTPSQAQCG